MCFHLLLVPAQVWVYVQLPFKNMHHRHADGMARKKGFDSATCPSTMCNMPRTTADTDDVVQSAVRACGCNGACSGGGGARTGFHTTRMRTRRALCKRFDLQVAHLFIVRFCIVLQMNGASVARSKGVVCRDAHTWCWTGGLIRQAPVKAYIARSRPPLPWR